MCQQNDVLVSGGPVLIVFNTHELGPGQRNESRSCGRMPVYISASEAEGTLVCNIGCGISLLYSVVLVQCTSPECRPAVVRDYVTLVPAAILVKPIKIVVHSCARSYWLLRQSGPTLYLIYILLLHRRQALEKSSFKVR